ncbi:MAG: hypothetical protein HQL49_10050, partial [Gammaproteobacteria bacterium]|nr:hypothetical protein [Gammaproteobacteria bacterium]
MQEEKDKNRLNEIDMLIALARQAEKGFYAEQTAENAQMVLLNLDKAIALTEALDIAETTPQQSARQRHPVQGNTIENLQQINGYINQYKTLFNHSLEIWEARGFTRDSGIGLKLREHAYSGLRDRLGLYDTQILSTQIYRLRWMEYEYFLYGAGYRERLQQEIDLFKALLQKSALNPPLTQLLESQLQAYQLELDKYSQLSEPKPYHQALESKGDLLLKTLLEHTISDFSILFRTLLYYEMEYRELGHQQHHISGLFDTLSKLQQRVTEAAIDDTEKMQLGKAISGYETAFNELVRLDQEISQFKDKISELLTTLTRHTQAAMEDESNIMKEIQQRTAADNRRQTMLNIIVTLTMLFVVIALVYWMIRRLGGKITVIGQNLMRIANGDLAISSQLPPEKRRDELDWIIHHINIVAANLSTSMRSLTTRNRELEIVSGKLAKYLSPQLYRSIFSGEQAVLIHSQRKRLTVFFSDIVGFTHTTETMESEELTQLLNSYLNEMSKIALEYGGTIDKFIGDAIMIFFGDPESKGEKNDSLSCVSMALAMRRRLNELQKIWEQEMGFAQPFKVRMGIASGYCTVGNFGSEERMDYTIIGSYVNLASRLEQHAQPDQILITHETYLLVKDKINC